MEDYIFKRVTEESYPDLLALHQAAYGKRETPGYYKHKMNTGYLGSSHLAYIAYSKKDGAPVAFYGVYPYQVQYKGQVYLVAQSGDTMTHPAHSGKGLFTELAKVTYALAKENGIQFVFGFPNHKSFPVLTKKLGWGYKENMNSYAIKVFTLPLAAVAKKSYILRVMYASYLKVMISFFKSSTKLIPNSVITDKLGGVYRTPAFVKYKQFYDNYFIDLNGKAAWVKVDGDMIVGDMELMSDREMLHAMSKLKQIAFWLGCIRIIWQVGKDTPLDHLLKGKAELGEGIYVCHLDLQSSLPLDDIKYVYADYDTF